MSIQDKIPTIKPLRVRVTEKLISESEQANSAHCMIAEAIKAAAPHLTNVTVDLQCIRYSDPKKGIRVAHLTPRDAQEALIDFDEGIHTQEFSFLLSKKNAQITKMQKVKAAESKAWWKAKKDEQGEATPTAVSLTDPETKLTEEAVVSSTESPTRLMGDPAVSLTEPETKLTADMPAPNKIRKRKPKVHKKIINTEDMVKHRVAPTILGGTLPPLANLSNSKRANMSQRRQYGLKSLRARPNQPHPANVDTAAAEQENVQ